MYQSQGALSIPHISKVEQRCSPFLDDVGGSSSRRASGLDSKQRVQNTAFMTNIYIPLHNNLVWREGMC